MASTVESVKRRCSLGHERISNLSAWLRPRPRITGRSAEKLLSVARASAGRSIDAIHSSKGDAMNRSWEGFSFFLANSHNREV